MNLQSASKKIAKLDYQSTKLYKIAKFIWDYKVIQILLKK